MINMVEENDLDTISLADSPSLEEAAARAAIAAAEAVAEATRARAKWREIREEVLAAEAYAKEAKEEARLAKSLVLAKADAQKAARRLLKGGTLTQQRRATSEEIKAVFNEWVLVTDRDPASTQFDAVREGRIRRAIDTYGFDFALAAVRGWRWSDYHSGENPSHKKYNDLELLLRDSKHIEMFANWELDETVRPRTKPGGKVRTRLEELEQQRQNHHAQPWLSDF